MPESFNFASLFIIDSIKSPTNAIRETNVPYNNPIKNGLFQLSKKAKNVATDIEHVIPPINPSIVLLGDKGDRALLPKDLPMKYEPISLATINKQEIKVKYRPEEFDKLSNDKDPLDE